MNSDFSMADSRLLIAPVNFYTSLIEKRVNINDLRGVYLEHVLCNLIKRQQFYLYHPFFTEPQYQGVSGSTNLTYEAKKRINSEKIRYAVYVISQIFEFPYDVKNHINMSYIRKSILYSLLILLKIYNKFLANMNN